MLSKTKTRKRIRMHGFRNRNTNSKNVLNNRRTKGRKKLTVTIKDYK